jgi:hypothetical protein
MTGALRPILAAVISLFVDDGSLALGLLGWTAVVGIGAWAWPGTPSAAFGAALFLGCAAILLASLGRAAADDCGNRPPSP